MDEQTPNLTGFETLPIYEVAQEWGEITKKPIIEHLHEMALAVYNEVLALDIDDNQKLISHYETVITYRKRTNSFWSYDPPKKEIASRRREPVYIPWVPEKSECFQYLKNPPCSIKEPEGLKNGLYLEGIKINREHFRAWCIASDYPLPRFWFSDQEQTRELATPAAHLEKAVINCYKSALDYIKLQPSETTNKAIIEKLSGTDFKFKSHEIFNLLADCGKIPKDKISTANAPDRKDPKAYKNTVISRMK